MANKTTKKKRTDIGKIADNKYFPYPAVSRSELALANFSLWHVRQNERKDPGSSYWMDRGNFGHCMAFENWRIKDKFIKAEMPVPINPKTQKPATWQLGANKAAKAEWLEQGLIPIKPEDWSNAEAMVEHIQNPRTTMEKEAKELLFGKPGMKVHNEVGMWWIDSTGVKCKIKIDALGRSQKKKEDGTVAKTIVISDLKVVSDASPRGFATSVKKTKGDEANLLLQAAFYLRGIKHIFADDIANGWKVAPFMFVLVEKDPPFHTGVYYIWPDQVEAISEQFITPTLTAIKENYDLEAAAIDLGETHLWPGYQNPAHSRGIHQVELPSYVLNDYGTKLEY